MFYDDGIDFELYNAYVFVCFVWFEWYYLCVCKLFVLALWFGTCTPAPIFKCASIVHTLTGHGFDLTSLDSISSSCVKRLTDW